eukprot:2334332-Pleurochrysis_carterae.AAC.1
MPLRRECLSKATLNLSTTCGAAQTTRVHRSRSKATTCALGPMWARRHEKRANWEHWQAGSRLTSFAAPMPFSTQHTRWSENAVKSRNPLKNAGSAQKQNVAVPAKTPRGTPSSPAPAIGCTGT